MKKLNTAREFISLDQFLGRRLRDKKFHRVFTEEMNRLRLAHEIRTLRQKKKMTQGEVAAKAAMPQSVVARIESGRHSFSIATLHKIARVFDKHISLVG